MRRDDTDPGGFTTPVHAQCYRGASFGTQEEGTLDGFSLPHDSWYVDDRPPTVQLNDRAPPSCVHTITTSFGFYLS